MNSFRFFCSLAKTASRFEVRSMGRVSCGLVTCLFQQVKARAITHIRDYIGKVYNKTFLESGANSEKSPCNWVIVHPKYILYVYIYAYVSNIYIYILYVNDKYTNKYHSQCFVQYSLVTLYPSLQLQLPLSSSSSQPQSHPCHGSAEGRWMPVVWVPVLGGSNK